MRGRSLLVLMWKHLMVRKRRFVHTAIELFSPVMFTLLVFSFRYELKPTMPSGLDNMVKMTEEKFLDERHHVPNPRFLLYTPDTKLAGELMASIGAKLGLTRLTSLPNKKTDGNYKGYFPYSNVSQIEDFVKDFYTNEAIIIFEDMDGEDWADRTALAYTIRMNHRFNTNTYKSLDGVPRNHQGFGDEYDEFMLLQWAIDTSYIYLRTGKTVPQTLSLQEFPYYGTERSEAVALVCSLLPWLCWLSLFIMFVFHMARLLEERTTGIQELIKMVGVSSNTLGFSHFLNVLPTGLMYCIFTTVLVKTSDNPLIEHSSGAIICIVLALHFVTVAGMAAACSYLAKSTQYTVTISIFAYIALWIPAEVLNNYPPSSHAVVLFCGILPHVPVAWLWNEISAFEQYGNGLTFADITKSHLAVSGPVLLGMGWLVVQSILFFFLAWYLSHVSPGTYGHAMPWDFFCQKQYWTQNEVKPESEGTEEVPFTKDNKYFEEPPKNMEVGIKIENVSKFFPKHVALHNLSLEVYKGEITVLLGHNGAGKTTLMSIITGMMSATVGKVYVNGLDSTAQREKVRSQLGLCPQHNLFFPDLTVLEHVMFFSLLKGGSFDSTRDSSTDLLYRLGLYPKANSKSSELSGGMKRRLQLACALTGGASVLVLDEPTSGLDVQTRRDLWDLLLSLRGDRTVLLTTHFMEEADALGDRVAALHLGRLRCHAAPMYLKKAIGTGYRLSFTTNGVPRDSAITDVVTSFVHDATVKEKTINSLSYNLPATGSSTFPNLFMALEERRSDLGIETIGVGVSTLEEVFLKLCSDTDTSFSEDEVDGERTEPTFNKVRGLPLYFRQFYVLIKRHFKYVSSKICSFIVLQALLPILMICTFTMISNEYEQTETLSQPEITLDLGLYTPLLERKVMYHVTADGATFRTLDEDYPKVVSIDTSNISDAILRTGKESTLEYNKYLVGVELDDTHAKALYTTVYRHAAPVSLNLLSNTIASQHLSGLRGRAITARNHPLDGALQATDPTVDPKSQALCVIWVVFIVLIILSTNINSASLPCKERASGSRHIHIMSGCPAALHWLSTLAFHTAVAVILLVLPAGLAAAVLDQDHTFNQTEFILTLMLVLTLGCMAFFALTYIVTFYFAERTTGVILILFMVVFGIVTTSLQATYGIIDGTPQLYMRAILWFSTYTMPPHTLTVAATKCTHVARINAYCNLNKQRCPNLFVQEHGFSTEKCCDGEKSLNYLQFIKYSPGPEILYLVVQLIVYMTLVVLTQKGFFKLIYDKIFNARLNRVPQPRNDEIVRAEAVYVDKQITLPRKQIEDANIAMLVNDVHKNYYQMCRKSCYAVRGLSFSVKKGECFGLLGVNGAGKSTTFKMLTAEEYPSKGDIYANGYLIKKNKDNYLRSLGYCPQFFGLDDFQTGNDNLQLLLTLRGLDEEDVAAEVKSWIDVVGLEKYSRRKVSGYSGGCTRRLGAAAALCSGAPLTLLDEPTAGVDVAARRRVWHALRRSLRQQRSVVITSHSMDEMEALCGRIGIMSGGELRALGTPAELRARHAQGHAVIIKLISARDEVDGGATTKTEVEKLKNTIHSKFNCTLKDEHKTMLHYHINDNMRYSELFSRLEGTRAAFPALLEDYSVTETTLEEVFLAFAKEARDTRNAVV